MKSTIIAILVLGTFAAVAGGVFITMQVAIGNDLLIGGLFLSLLGGALLALDKAGNKTNADN